MGSGHVPISEWLQRLRAEYQEMPGLSLSEEQMQKLWGLDAFTIARPGPQCERDPGREMSPMPHALSRRLTCTAAAAGGRLHSRVRPTGPHDRCGECGAAYARPADARPTVRR
jgi:hypothetical protein